MKKNISLLLCLIMMSFTLQINAADNTELDARINETAQYLSETVSKPQVSSVGGEWTVLGLARSNANIPEAYYADYYDTVEAYAKEHNGVLSENKYTEYSRVILALTAIGKDPTNVSGYDLLTPLSDYEKTVAQGINGSIWAIMALDSADYDMPENKSAQVQATREMYIKQILDSRTTDGGWSFSGDNADVDLTAMALQALSKHQADHDVYAATEKAISYLSEQQNDNGGFSSWGTENSESSAQVLTAMCELGISVNDERFVKNDHTVVDALLEYYSVGGGFKHTKDGDVNLMATEQCFYALVDLQRINEGKNSLYRMSDAAVNIADSDENVGLPNKIEDIKKMEIIHPDITFGDITESACKSKIEALAARGIINGKTDSEFDPYSTMTRAEYAAIVTRALGLTQKSESYFDDVKSTDWFYGYVGTAYEYEIVNGVSDTEFDPNGTITREEAAVMTARAAKLCGMNTESDEASQRDILAAFTDYTRVADWAREALAFCYSNGILPDEEIEINPQENVTREDIAQMLYNMLDAASLL